MRKRYGIGFGLLLWCVAVFFSPCLINDVLPYFLDIEVELANFDLTTYFYTGMVALMGALGMEMLKRSLF